MNQEPMRLSLVRTVGGSVYANAVIADVGIYTLFYIGRNGVALFAGPRMDRFLVATNTGRIDVQTTNSSPIPLIRDSQVGERLHADEPACLKWMPVTGGVILRVVRPDGSLPYDGNLIVIPSAPLRRLIVLGSPAWATLGIALQPGTYFPHIHIP